MINHTTNNADFNKKLLKISDILSGKKIDEFSKILNANIESSIKDALPKRLPSEASNIEALDKYLKPSNVLPPPLIQQEDILAKENAEFFSKVEDIISSWDKIEIGEDDYISQKNNNFSFLLTRSLIQRRISPIEPVPLDYILDFKKKFNERKAKRENEIKKSLIMQKKLEKKAALKEKFAKKYWLNLLFEKKEQINKKITDFIGKIIINLHDIKFRMSLSKNQRQLIKGFRQKTHESVMLKVAVKRNINLNSVKDINNRMDAIPE